MIKKLEKKVKEIFSDKEKLIRSLSLRPACKDADIAELEKNGYICRKNEDITFILVSKIADSKDKPTVFITKTVAKAFGYDEEELYNRALDNIRLEAKASGLIDITETVVSGGSVSDAPPADFSAGPTILTNRDAFMGANILAVPDVIGSICATIKGGAYILPSSIHEVILMPKSFGHDVNDLRKMVRTINATDVSPEDRLSDNIYEYDKKTKKIVIV